MYIVSGIIVVLIVINYVLSYKLYETPKNEKYFNNVNGVNVSRDKFILPEPKYVISISIFVGILIGTYLSLTTISNINKYVAFFVVVLVGACYFMEITRSISIREGKIILTKAFSKKIEIDLRDVRGMYIYSYSKKFLKGHAFTTKLVISTNDKKRYKFVLSSLSNKSVLNMMKENFGISEYKMFISKRKE